MPKALERALKKRAAGLAKAGKLKGKGTTAEKENAYVYGTLRNTGWKPKRER